MAKTVAVWFAANLLKVKELNFIVFSSWIIKDYDREISFTIRNC